MGPTGATGPAGSSSLPLAAGKFLPNAGGATVTIVAQSGEFASAQYAGVGNYIVNLNVIPGVTIANQAIITGTANETAQSVTVTVVAIFSVDHVRLGITLFDAAGAQIDTEFYLHVALLV